MSNMFINANEVLLVKASYHGGFYFQETDTFTTTYETAFDFVNGCDDFVQAWRLDIETMTMEDVTDICAEAWLKDWDGAGELPEFVNGSYAYDRWLEEPKSKPVSQREHGTLNKQMAL